MPVCPHRREDDDESKKGDEAVIRAVRIKSVKIENERGGKRIKNQCRKKTNIPYKEKKKVTATCLPFASLAGESAAGMYE